MKRPPSAIAPRIIGTFDWVLGVASVRETGAAVCIPPIGAACGPEPLAKEWLA